MSLSTDQSKTGVEVIDAADGLSGTISLGGGMTAAIARTHLNLSFQNDETADRAHRQGFKVWLSESNPGTSGYDQISWERSPRHRPG